MVATSSKTKYRVNLEEVRDIDEGLALAERRRA
jgi:hypothetical protein